MHSVATGVGTANDVASSYWGNLNDQVRLMPDGAPTSRLYCSAHPVMSPMHGAIPSQFRASAQRHKRVDLRVNVLEIYAQVALVCEQLREIPELQGGYNAVGFSQGTLPGVAASCTLYAVFHETIIPCVNAGILPACVYKCQPMHSDGLTASALARRPAAQGNCAPRMQAVSFCGRSPSGAGTRGRRCARSSLWAGSTRGSTTCRK